MRFVRSAAVLAVGLVLGAAAVAVAVDPPQQYTGCLAKDGTLYRVAAGGSPVKACAKTETQISWNQQGPAGTNGTAVLNGTVPPTASVGSDGDFYIDTTANVLYGPKTADGWPETGVSLIGPKGDKGDKGDQGPANLDALNGSACTVGDKPGTLSYAVDSVTGAVTLTCARNAHTISVAVTNGVLSNIDIRFPASDGTICSDAAACSFMYDTGASYSAVLLSNSSAFRYDCGDAVMQQATASGGVWSGTCGGTGVAGWSPFTSDHVVTIDLTYHVSVNATNGETFDFRIHDQTTGADVAYCSDTTTCAADVPAGHSVFVAVSYPTYFSLTCPGGTETMPEWTGSCATSSLSSDFTVSVEGW